MWGGAGRRKRAPGLETGIMKVPNEDFTSKVAAWLNVFAKASRNSRWFLAKRDGSLGVKI